jgi:hypothetical protein
MLDTEEARGDATVDDGVYVESLLLDPKKASDAPNHQLAYHDPKHQREPTLTKEIIISWKFS